MSRRTTDPASTRHQIERRRIEHDKTILAWLRSHGQAACSAEISRATRISCTNVIGRLQALVRVGAVRRAETARDRAGKAALTFQAAAAQTPPVRRETAFTPLRPARCTVIPVRAGGRIAETLHNEPAVTLSRTEYREIS